MDVENSVKMIGGEDCEGERQRILKGFEDTMEFLGAVEKERDLLVHLSDDQRVALYRMCGSFAARSKDRESNKALRLRFKKMEREKGKAEDRAVVASTGLRQSQLRGAVEPLYVKPPSLLQDAFEEEAPPRLIEQSQPLNKPKSCYCCGERFSVVHHFYASMCLACADLNFRKRMQTFDLSGRVAIVTGARVKIGYHIALKLLRAGCHVVVVTRFPHDARVRYSTEADFASFSSRIQFYGVDLRHTPSVEKMCSWFLTTLPRLDFLIHNSCQTVRRPPAFYQHLLDAERLHGEGEAIVGDLTQIPLLKSDLVTEQRDLLFPVGALDVDGQQRDLRDVNSWKLSLSEVSTVEVAEVFLVNVIAPFVMNSRLKPLFGNTGDAHIVNVSAMEGQFYKTFKTFHHPHTNMGKAALNMMTRTSAQDYARFGIFMNSVDTGWVTDENPSIVAERLAQEGFAPPLDIIDGAARVLDPIFDGFITGKHQYGQFWKNYKTCPW